MKSKILFIAFALLFIFSCGTPKTVTTTPTAPVSNVVAEVQSSELAPELAEGKNLYANNCVGCHKMFQPKAFTKEEWKPILVRMQKFANLNDAEMVSISNYINSQL